MKTASDPRHQKRITLLKQLFAVSFTNPDSNKSSKLPILAHLEKIDKEITEAAPQWPLEKVAKVDLAVLRLAVYELLVVAEEPPKVIIDEAVELAKEFGNDSSGSFVNGVLGTVLKNSAEKT